MGRLLVAGIPLPGRPFMLRLPRRLEYEEGKERGEVFDCLYIVGTVE